jgi:hypothetical protein
VLTCGAAESERERRESAALGRGLGSLLAEPAHAGKERKGRAGPRGEERGGERGPG